MENPVIAVIAMLSAFFRSRHSSWRGIVPTPCAAAILALALLAGCSVPTRVPRGGPIAADKVPQGVEVVHFLSADNAVLQGWWQPVKPPHQTMNAEQRERWLARSRVTVLFCHGADDNADTLMSDVAERSGYRVFTFDYRGFGNSAALPTTNKGMQQDAIAAWEYIRCHPRTKDQPIIVMGHSMGAGYALAVAAHANAVGDPVRAVVAQSGFSSWRYAASGFVPFFGYILAWSDGEDPVDWAAKLGQTPLLITHAKNDRLVLFENAGRLQRAASRAGTPVSMLTPAKGGHAVMYFFDDEVAANMTWWLDTHGARVQSPFPDAFVMFPTFTRPEFTIWETKK